MFYEVLLLSTFVFYGFILARFDLRIALLAFVVLIPFTHKELFSFVLWDLLPVRALFVGIILSLLFDNKPLKRLKRNFWDKYLLMLMLLLVIRILSLFNSTSIKSSLLLLIFFLNIMAIYIVLRYAYEKFGYVMIRYLLKIYVIVGFFTSTFSYIQLFLYRCCNHILPGVWALVTKQGSFVRVGSFFWDINHYAAYMATVLILAVPFVLVSSGRTRLYWSLGFLYSFFALVLTESRSGWGAFALALGLMFSLLFIRVGKKLLRGKRFYAGSLAFFAVLAALLLRFGSPVVDRLDTITDIGNNDSIKTHVYLLAASYEMFLKNPLLGSGYGSFSSALRQSDIAPLFFPLVPSENEIKVPAHSVWGEVLGETGGLGFFIYALFMYFVLKSGFKAVFGTRGERLYLSIALFSAIVGLLVAGLIYSYNLEFFWFVIFMGILSFKQIYAKA